MVTNSLRLCLSGKVFSPFLLKDSFAGYSILGWQFSFFSTLSIYLPSAFWPPIFLKRNLLIILLRISSFLLLSRFFFFAFWKFDYSMSWCESSEFILFGVFQASWMFIFMYFIKFGKVFSNYFLKFSLLPSLNNFFFFFYFLNLIISIVLYSGLKILFFFFPSPCSNLQILLVNYFSCIFQFQNLFCFLKICTSLSMFSFCSYIIFLTLYTSSCSSSSTFMNLVLISLSSISVIRSFSGKIPYFFPLSRPNTFLSLCMACDFLQKTGHLNLIIWYLWKSDSPSFPVFAVFCLGGLLFMFFCLFGYCSYLCVEDQCGCTLKLKVFSDLFWNFP